jgi:hypothetical protein
VEYEAARLHHAHRRGGSGVAGCGARTAAGHAGHRVHQRRFGGSDAIHGGPGGDCINGGGSDAGKVRAAIFQGQKNDFRDAEAIAEAVQRPTMKFIATRRPPARARFLPRENISYRSAVALATEPSRLLDPEI